MTDEAELCPDCGESVAIVTPAAEPPVTEDTVPLETLLADVKESFQLEETAEAEEAPEEVEEESTYAAPEQEEEPEAPRKKKSRKVLRIVIPILAVLLLLAAAAGASTSAATTSSRTSWIVRIGWWHVRVATCRVISTGILSLILHSIPILIMVTIGNSHRRRCGESKGK